MQTQTPAQAQRQARMQTLMQSQTKAQTREKRTREEIVGDTTIDLGKLIFGGIVLAGIFSADINKTWLVLGGFVLCLAFVAFGTYWMTKK